MLAISYHFALKYFETSRFSTTRIGLGSFAMARACLRALSSLPQRAEPSVTLSSASLESGVDVPNSEMRAYATRTAKGSARDVLLRTSTHRHRLRHRHCASRPHDVLSPC